MKTLCEVSYVSMYAYMCSITGAHTGYMPLSKLSLGPDLHHSDYHFIIIICLSHIAYVGGHGARD